MRNKALELLNSATEAELKIVKGMTTKKYDALTELRPFVSWYDVVSKT